MRLGERLQRSRGVSPPPKVRRLLRPSHQQGQTFTSCSGRSRLFLLPRPHSFRQSPRSTRLWPECLPLALPRLSASVLSTICWFKHQAGRVGGPFPAARHSEVSLAALHETLPSLHRQAAAHQSQGALGQQWGLCVPPLLLLRPLAQV